MTTEDKIACVLDVYPDLDANGLHADADIEKNPIDPTQFNRALVWLLMNGSKAKSVYRDASSYGLKHIASRNLEAVNAEVPVLAGGGSYMSNGAFICAAAHLGYIVQRIPGSMNVRINIRKPRI